MMGAVLLGWIALQASTSPAVQHLRAGLEADKSGQPDAAIVEFQKAGELDPESRSHPSPDRLRAPRAGLRDRSNSTS